MLKVNIHRYENEMWGRSHLPFFKKFDEYLSKFFDINVINYNIDGNTFSGQINTICNTGNFEHNPPLSDVDYVIENAETGEIKVISFTEYFNSYISHLAKSKFTTTVLLSHFNWHNVYHWMKCENAISELYKIKPFIFLPYKEFDVEAYRQKRKEIIEYEDKMFWLGSGIETYRSTIKCILEKKYLQPFIQTSHEDYLEKLIKSKIGLSFYLNLDKYNTPFDHTGEFCYRDIEYMLLGLPYIRIEYKDTLYNPLIPNYHYISIPREHAYVEYEKFGDEGVANLYIKKYEEIIDDNDFLKYVSNNQIEWSNKNLLNDNKEKITFELLELNKWLKL